MGAYVEIASAAVMTLMALMKNSPATRAVCASLPKENMPTPGTKTMAGSAPRIAGESGSA